MSQATNITLKTLIENALNQNEVAEYLKPVVIDADWATLNHATLEDEELLISLSNDQLSVCVILAKTDEIKDTLNCQTEMLRATAVMPLAEFCIMNIDGVDCYVLSGNTGLTGSIDADANLFIEQVNAVVSGFDDAMHVIEKHL